MDRRSLITNAGIAGVLAAGIAPAVHAQAAMRWRIASSFPKSLDTLFGVCDVFAKKVSDMTGGKFVISTHAAGELMPAFGVLDGVSNGTVEMANMPRTTSSARTRPTHSTVPFPSGSTAARCRRGCTRAMA